VGTFAGMEDTTWTNRDLPVLKAAVKLYETTGRARIPVTDIAAAVGFDKESTLRAIRALYRQPYFEEGVTSGQGDFVWVGPPTGEALRAAGQWPTAENLLERLVAALNAAGDDESFEEPERSKLKQAAAWLGSFGSQVVIGALGGAGGNLLG
jgi:hypothetical protein